jgi:hypothetical protein
MSLPIQLVLVVGALIFARALVVQHRTGTAPMWQLALAAMLMGGSAVIPVLS